MTDVGKAGNKKVGGKNPKAAAAPLECVVMETLF